MIDPRPAARTAPGWAARLIVVALAAPAGARADTVVQVGVAAGAGWSNINGAAPVAGTASQTSEAGTFYGEVRPSLLAQVNSARSVFRASYAFSGRLNFDYKNTTSYSNHVDVGLSLQPSGRLLISMLLGATQADTLGQITETPAGTGQAQILPTQNQDMLTVNASELLAYEAGPRLRLGQRLLATLTSLTSAVENPSAILETAVSLDRTLRRDAIGGELRLGFNHLVDLTPLMGGMPIAVSSPDSVVVTGLARWTRDWGPRWHSLVMAGLSEVWFLDGKSRIDALPVGNLAINYFHEVASAGLSYSHSAAANRTTGTLAQTDLASLRASMPLSNKVPLLLAASAGFSWTQKIPGSPPQPPGGFAKAVLADLSLIWAARPDLLLSARYSIAYQFDFEDKVTRDYTLHIATLNLTYRYSSSPILAPLPGVSSRVDGTGAGSFTPPHAAEPEPGAR